MTKKAVVQPITNHASFRFFKGRGPPKYFCLFYKIDHPPDLHISLSQHRQNVEHRCEFITAGLAPLLEAVTVFDRRFKKLRCESGGDIKSKDFEEGICLGDEER
jgi:hypothetical protein